MVPDIVELDELRILVVVDNESDTFSSVDSHIPKLPEVAALISRTPTSAVYDGHECKVVLDRLCCAGHGFSALLTGRAGGREHTALFDVGPYSHLWLGNAKLLGIDLAAIEAVFLSHWHADHSGALPGVVEAIAAARKGHPPPIVDLHPDRPDQRGVLLPSGTIALLAEEPTFDAIARAGGEIARNAGAHALCKGFFLGSGCIERVTSYETGLAGHHSFRGGSAQPDPLVLDERFVAARVRGRGITVLSACSHAGIVNACLAAKKFFDDAPIDVALGGYHLAGKAMEERIPATVRDLKERIRPRVVAPGHCTGWRAKAALAAAFAPERYGPSVVGTSYVLTG